MSIQNSANTNTLPYTHTHTHIDKHAECLRYLLYRFLLSFYGSLVFFISWREGVLTMHVCVSVCVRCFSSHFFKSLSVFYFFFLELFRFISMCVYVFFFFFVFVTLNLNISIVLHSIE